MLSTRSYYEVDPPEDSRCCGNCDYYFHGTCGMPDATMAREEIEEMSQEEYTELVEKDEDDFCDRWEHEEYEKDPSDLARERREMKWMQEG